MFGHTRSALKMAESTGEAGATCERYKNPLLPEMRIQR